jgi:hypothetical protein
MGELSKLILEFIVTFVFVAMIVGVFVWRR